MSAAGAGQLGGRGEGWLGGISYSYAAGSFLFGGTTHLIHFAGPDGAQHARPPRRDTDSVLLAATLDKLGEIGPLPADITVHLDAGYDSQKTRAELESRGMKGEIAHKGDKAPIQAGPRWHDERTNAWHNAFNRLQRCYERNETVINAFFDLADAIITLRRLIREAWTLYRWDTRPSRRP